MSKISGYANSVSALGTDDLLDVSEKISSSPDVYESRKMTGATLATFISSYAANILSTNGLSMTGNRTHDLGSYVLTFQNAGFAIEGAQTITAGSAGSVDMFNLYDSTSTLLHRFNSTFISLWGQNQIASEVFGVTGHSILKGIGTAGTNKVLDLYNGDTTPTSLWSFRSNGDVVLGQSTKIDYGANTLTFGSTSSEVFQFNGSATAPTVIFGNGVASSTLINLDTPSLKNGDRLDILNRLYIGELSGSAILIEPRGSASKTRLQGNLDLQGVVELGNTHGLQTEGSSIGNFKKLATDFFGFTNYDDSVEIAGIKDGTSIQNFWSKAQRIGDNHLTNINSVAVLELDSTTKGLLLPRMTAAQASAITAVDGLVLYVTSTDATFTSVGFWGYENGAWVKL